MRVLITGGAGFIGSQFARTCLDNGMSVVVLDGLMYAGSVRNIPDGVELVRCDIRDQKGLRRLIPKADYVAHFAAESQVLRSLSDPARFMETNVVGTFNVLDLSKELGFRKFLHVSTDEVYGSSLTGGFLETDPLRPTNPYSASKAAAEMMVSTYREFYHLPIVIVRPCNNYGLRQYPEKLIPLSIKRLLDGKSAIVHGDGRHQREWIHVTDCCAAIFMAMVKGEGTYNIGSGEECTNLEIATRLVAELGGDIVFDEDRPSNDRRYFLDNTRIRELGWRPTIQLADGLIETVRGYKRHWI